MHLAIYATFGASCDSGDIVEQSHRLSDTALRHLARNPTRPKEVR